MGWTLRAMWRVEHLNRDMASPTARRSSSYAQESSEVILASEVSLVREHRFDVGLSEFNRVLGGGLVLGSVVLLGATQGLANRLFCCKFSLI